MEPGGSTLVMATGIVSIDATQHGMLLLGRALFWLNWAAYLWLLLINALRFVFHRDEMISNFVAPERGAPFLTLAAGTCVLATQSLLEVYLLLPARVVEETALVPDDFYAPSFCEQFYAVDDDCIEVVPAFVAMVAADAKVRLNGEHSAFCRTFDEAMAEVPFGSQRNLFAYVKREFIDRPPCGFLRIAAG